MSTFRALAAVILLALVAAPPAAAREAVEAPAPAADPYREAERLAEEGRAAYEAGDYAAAVAAYLEAYRLAPTGALLYNIAYVYDRKLLEAELAITYYRRYLSTPDADPDVALRATTRLFDLKTELAERAAPASAPAPVPTAEPVPLPVAAPTSAPESGAATSRGPGWTWGWVAVGAGAATLAGGVTLGLLARRASEEQGDTVELSEKLRLRDDGRAFALSGDVLMGVGLAATVTGAVLLLTSERTPDGEVITSGLRVEPTLLPHGAGLVVGGPL